MGTEIYTSTDGAREDSPLITSSQNVDDEQQPQHSLPQRPMLLVRQATSLLEPFADDSGSISSVKSGLTTICLFGGAIGILAPKNPELPTIWYRTISSVIGYTYFLAWSVSFYPQVATNYRRKSTIGLSNDFSVINHVGYICYTLYTSSLYWSQSIHEEYSARNGPEAKITVQSNDVAFAIHALILSFVWIAQIMHYGGFAAQPLSKIIRYLLFAIFLVCFSAAGLVVLGIGGLTWLDFMYLLSFVKILITISKYIPQVLLNFRRRTTTGWSPWNVTLDVTGGTLSLLQLLLDCFDMKDWSGITGNLAKLGLSFVTIFFDAIFLVQHYILYRNNNT